MVCWRLVLPVCFGVANAFVAPSSSSNLVSLALHAAVDVTPSGDTLVLFRADRMLHEVCPAKAPRFAATVWLYGGSKEQARRAKAAAGKAAT